MRQFFKKIKPQRWEWYTLIFAIIVITFFFIYKNERSKGAAAHVRINGEGIIIIPLTGAGDEVISLRTDYGVPADLEIKDERIRFINVECPDHICEKTGFIGAAGQAAVCLPNKTSVVITADDD